MEPEQNLEDAPSPEGLPGPGEMLDGKYRVLETLGVGGMGAVLAGEHVELEQPVALKFLLPHVAKLPGALDRFLREARAAARIRGDHAVRILDVTRRQNGGLPYIVMERLIGTDLAEVLGERGPLPIAEATGYVQQAIVAIAEAHAAGIVHRDLKPSNLFLATRPDGSRIVKVLDFGVSKITAVGAPSAVSLTEPGAFVGSPQYMSPEQVRDGRSVDTRADIWGLGVILYELLADALPFEANSLPHIFVQIMTEAPRPLRARRPDIPEALEAIILRCLEKEPDARIADVAALARALAPFAPELAPVSAPMASSPAAEAQAILPPSLARSPAPSSPERVNSRAETLPQVAVERAAAPPPPRLHRGLMVALGAVTVALLTALGLRLAGVRSPAPIVAEIGAPPSSEPLPDVQPGPVDAAAPLDPQAPAAAPPLAARAIASTRAAVSASPRAPATTSARPRVLDLQNIKPLE